MKQHLLIKPLTDFRFHVGMNKLVTEEGRGLSLSLKIPTKPMRWNWQLYCESKQVKKSQRNTHLYTQVRIFANNLEIKNQLTHTPYFQVPNCARRTIWRPTGSCYGSISISRKMREKIIFWNFTPKIIDSLLRAITR